MAVRTFKISIIALALSAIIAVGGAFAAIFINKYYEKSVTIANGQYQNYVEISSESQLFDNAYSPVYNDEAFISLEDDRKILTLTQDITLSLDITINRDVNINLNGYMLDLNGHTLTFSHNYYGAFCIYSGGSGKITDGTTLGLLAINTPNADVEIADGVIDCNMSKAGEQDVLLLAEKYAKACITMGQDGGYYLSKDDIPLCYRYGNYAMDFAYEVTESTVAYTITYNGESVQGSAPIGILGSNSAKISAAAIDIFEGYIARYLVSGGDFYTIYHAVQLPSGNSYLSVDYALSAEPLQGNGDVLISYGSGNILLDAPENCTFTLTLTVEGLSKDYTFYSLSDTYRYTIADNVISAMLSRQKTDEDGKGYFDSDGNAIYETFGELMLSATFVGEEEDEYTSYEYSSYTLISDPEQLSFTPLGTGYIGIYASQFGVEDISFLFISDGTYGQNDGVFVFDEESCTISLKVINQTVFESLERISAILQVNITIDGQVVSRQVNCGFTWDTDSSITGEGGGSPKSRFGTYFAQVNREMTNVTLNFTTNQNFTMRSNFSGKIPYLAYTAVRIDSNGDTLQESQPILKIMLGESQIVEGSLPAVSVLKGSQKTYSFEIDSSLIPMCGATYIIYYWYNFGTGWVKYSQSSALNISGIIICGSSYSADGQFDESGTTYFTSENIDFYNYILNICSPNYKYIQTQDIGMDFYLCLSVAGSGFTCDSNPYTSALADYNWLPLLTGMITLDVRGRGFSNSDLSLLSSCVSLQNLYIGGYEGNINNSLTSLENLPELTNLIVLDVRYSYISSFTPITIEKYPSLQEFYCKGNTILFLGVSGITDNRYGTAGRNNYSCLQALISAGVNVDAYSQGMTEAERKLSGIITQQSVMLKAEGSSRLPILYSQKADDMVVLKYDESTLSGTLYKKVNGSFEEISSGDRDLLEQVISKVEAIYSQFPDDSNLEDYGSLLNDGAAARYGIAQETAKTSGIGGSTKNYYPYIEIKMYEFEWDDGYLTGITFKLSYYKLETRDSITASWQIESDATYIVTHSLSVIYGNAENSQTSGYQDIVQKLLPLASGYISTNDKFYYDEVANITSLEQANNAISGVKQILATLEDESLSDDLQTIDASLLLEINGYDGKYTSAIEYFNALKQSLITQTVNNFYNLDAYKAVFAKPSGYIYSTERYAPGSYYLGKTDGFWHEFDKGNNYVGGSYSPNNNFSTLDSLIASYNSLEKEARNVLEGDSFIGKSTVTKTRQSNKWVVSTATEIEYTTRGWLQYLFDEVNNSVLWLNGSTSSDDESLALKDLNVKKVKELTEE